MHYDCDHNSFRGHWFGMENLYWSERVEKGIVKGGGKRETWHDLVKFIGLTEGLAVYLLISTAHLTRQMHLITLDFHCFQWSVPSQCVVPDKALQEEVKERRSVCTIHCNCWQHKD